MKGIKITIGKRSCEVITEGVRLFFFVTVLAGSEQARVALYTCDEKRRIKKTWLKGCPFPLGERLEVEWSEVDEETGYEVGMFPSA